MLPARLERLPGHALVNGLAVFEARDRRARLLGLALLDHLPSDRALLIPGCRAVHTCGMRFLIDIVFLDRRGDVLRLVEAAEPRRAFGAPAARAVLETHAGQAERFIEAGAGDLAATSL